MFNEHLLGDLDTRHDALFDEFVHLVSDENLSPGALMHVWESMVNLTITAVKKNDVATWKDVHAGLEHFITGNIDALLQYARSMAKDYLGTRTRADDDETYERLVTLLSAKGNQE